MRTAAAIASNDPNKSSSFQARLCWDGRYPALGQAKTKIARDTNPTGPLDFLLLAQYVDM